MAYTQDLLILARQLQGSAKASVPEGSELPIKNEAQYVQGFIASELGYDSGTQIHRMAATELFDHEVACHGSAPRLRDCPRTMS